MTCISAVLALATASLGLFATRATNETSQAQTVASNLEDQVRGLTANVNDLSAERDALQAQLDVADDRILELEAQEDALEPAPTPTSAATAGATRRSGSIDWNNGTALDFDSMDAQWGQFDDLLQPTDYEVGGYITSTNLIRLGQDSAYLKLEEGQVDDYATCSSASGYVPGGGGTVLSIDNYRPGDQFCWRTNEDRSVALSLTSRNDKQFTTDVAVYEK